MRTKQKKILELTHNFLQGKYTLFEEMNQQKHEELIYLIGETLKDINTLAIRIKEIKNML